MTDAPVQVVYSRPESLTDTPTTYCPGCTHGVAHRLIAEVLDEMDLREKTIGVAPVGCSVFAYNYFDCDFVEAAHGRAPAMATGIKRVLPDRIVFTYQGDGDLASIGMAEIMHACGARREHHRHLHQQRHLRHDRRADGAHHPARPEDHLSPDGRDVEQTGFPIRMAEVLATMDGPGTRCGAACTIRRISAWPRKPSARPSKSSGAGWASRWSSCSPPARPTGA